ncbi:MAG: class I tRNA ligase family protein, partial [Actinomycetota bacterium]
TETNWFFRLSAYTERLIDLIESNELRITPAPFRDEILAFARRGLGDISVSRSVERAHGWGIGVPGDPTQVIYVWFDALANYISALDYGTNGDAYREWWRDVDERIHVVGKGITRFHAIYWPAFLLSAGEPLPTRIHVHPYLSVDGAKISKSTGSGPSPTDIATTHGSDALRWWITNEVSAVSDTDFTIDRLVDNANNTLANGLGNAINRIATIRHRTSHPEPPPPDTDPLPETANLSAHVAGALANFDRRRASDHIVTAIGDVNRHIELNAPWQLAKDPARQHELHRLLDTYTATLTAIARAIEPITPDLATRAIQQLANDSTTKPTPIYARLDADQTPLQAAR